MDPLAVFLAGLFESGSVSVELAPEPPPFTARSASLLQEQAAGQSLEMPATAPRYRPEVAAWAALLFHEACRLLVHPERRVPENGPLHEPLPGDADAGDCFSADLVLQHLPALAGLARRTSATQDLISFLLNLSADWPLSSVGIRGVEPLPGRLHTIAQHASLRTLYTDRVLAAADLSRLGPSWLEISIREAAGDYPELLPHVIREAIAWQHESFPEHS